MGSQHSHEKGGSEGGGLSTPRSGSRRGTVEEKRPESPEPAPATLVPVEKLAKLLAQRTHKEEGGSGISENIFVKSVFPEYPELGEQVFGYLRGGGGGPPPPPPPPAPTHVPTATFRGRAERLLAMLDDTLVVETYLKMFSSECEEGHTSRLALRRLLLASYRLSMDHYPDGPRACYYRDRTLDAIVSGCFGNKSSHTVGFVVRWLEDCKRLVLPIHRYVVHVLSCAHRSLSAAGAGAGAGAGQGEGEGGTVCDTPCLEKGYAGGAGGAGGEGEGLLPPSVAWLLAAVVSPKHTHTSVGRVVCGRAWVSRLVCLLPSHWTPLYSAARHGLAGNRLTHHATAYRGPTVLLLGGGGRVVALAVDHEWRESQHYWGGPDSILLTVHPTFEIIARGPKLVYLNLQYRGFPKGLRLGPDPAAPAVVVDDDFQKLTVLGDDYPLNDIEVKLSAAEWGEHPDRYLLELAGRPQYNNAGA